MGLFDKIFGSYSDRELKKIDPIINKIESLDKPTQALSDQELKDKTEEFKKRLKNGESLDDILPEAFAVCREASYRVLGMKHYRVQLYGGVILHQGRIAEMKTGEGKTLMATLAAYLNALTGKGVHIVTVNDYLATRDRQWMGKVYEFLGLSVGNIVHGLSPVERREAYNSDITYGTNNEFGFDYLRDNMVIYKEERVQRELNFAIVDEVDSILIDEARTPLIISGQGAESTDLYMRADNFVKKLTHRVIEESEKTNDPFDREFKEETVDYLVDEKQKSASLTDLGVEKAEQFFNIENLADPNNMEIAHNIKQALKANSVMKRDVDYVVKDGEIIIVDEFTGRMMLGRRYSDGLHQAIEAKEGMEIKKESKTLATITFQNYFRMYKKLSGMTGTAKTEEEEFREIYNVDVIEVPTNKPVIRQDDDDGIYSTEAGKFMAVIEDIKECHAKGQPVLVGTVSIDKSELLSSLLKKQGIKHNVLNAKFHEQESEIVAQAGRLGAVTIATNMAGRGTDIVLGGNPEYMAKEVMKKKNLADEVFEQIDGYAETDNKEILAAREEYKNLVEKFKDETKEEAAQVIKAGGLHIIGTERHESRRIDNQLRGRSGRQGDPGSSKFYISAEDDLIRLFAGERFKQVMDKSKVEEDESLETPILTRLIETAQRRVESNNFAIRKSVLKYDDVMNKQRGIIYEERKKVLEGQDLKDDILKMVDGIILDEIHFFLRSKVDEDSRDYEGLYRTLNEIFDFNENDFARLKDLNKLDDLEYKIKEIAREKYSSKEDEFGAGVFREVERVVLLQVVDEKWMDHIDAMDQLKRGIGLRAMGNEDPVRAYGNEGFDMFEAMNDAIRRDTVKMLYHVINPERMERKRVAKNISEVGGSDSGEEKKGKTYVRKEKKIGRNDPCPCGSGKKYKNCHGR
ncbi:preprotein translocase subunit SecA [Neofamilia massiliensis]|uniref:preprotein translocase subunit SecA n=1 Tax=Neofamilia massiliensis TaxID=1673724 RepID=UPI0006BB835F|nr:preprotein translocase subunit SecA [Neofamilia massiliensis]